MTREELNDLIDRYLSGRATPAEEKLIDDFFDAQERKPALPHYKLSEEMWESIEERVHAVRTPSTEVPGKKKLGMQKVLIAVFLVLVTASGFYFQDLLSDSSPHPWTIAESPNGQKSLITLADGSRIFLNSGTSISYPETFDPDKREITLRGEAFFEIARDESRPFMVRSGDVVTRVLGTSFNIEAFEGEATRVTVAKGKVQVEIESNVGGDSAVHAILTSGQQVVYENDGSFITRNVDTEQFLAWKSHTLYFDNHTLEEVAARLERWYNMSIEFENERIKKCRVNGQYKGMDLRSVLESIHYMYPVEYKFSGQNHVVLYGEGCDE